MNNVKTIPLKRSFLRNLYGYKIDAIKARIKKETGEDIKDEDVKALYKQIGLDLDKVDEKVVDEAWEDPINKQCNMAYVRKNRGGATIATYIALLVDIGYSIIDKEEENPYGEAIYNPDDRVVNIAHIWAYKMDKPLENRIKAYRDAGWKIIDLDAHLQNEPKVVEEGIKEYLGAVNTIDNNKDEWGAPVGTLPNGDSFEKAKKEWEATLKGWPSPIAKEDKVEV